ncbi:DUF732 domain-containing protein [Mycolicibacterium sp. XJ1819]
MLRTASVFALSAALLSTATAVSASAHADPVDDAFLAAVTEAGVVMGDPGRAVMLGEQVCPMLSEPGQTAADVTSRVAEVGGMSLGPATMFTGIAISMFCPAMVSSIGNGALPFPIPLSIPGW